MFCCAIFGCDSDKNKGWCRRDCPASTSSVATLSSCLPCSRTTRHVAACWAGSENSPCWSTLICHCSFTLQSCLFHHTIYCIATWTSMLIQGRKWEDGTGEHVASHTHCRKTWPGQPPSPTDALQVRLLLNCALSHHVKLARWGTLGFVQATSSTYWLCLNLSNYLIKL